MLEKVWADNGYLNFRVNHAELVQETLDEHHADQRPITAGRMTRGSRCCWSTPRSTPPDRSTWAGPGTPLIGDTLARCFAQVRLRGHHRIPGQRRGQAGRALGLGRGATSRERRSSPPRTGRRPIIAGRLLPEGQRAHGDRTPRWRSRWPACPSASRPATRRSSSRSGETTELMLDGIKESLASINVAAGPTTPGSHSSSSNGEAKSGGGAAQGDPVLPRGGWGVLPGAGRRSASMAGTPSSSSPARTARRSTPPGTWPITWTSSSGPTSSSTSWARTRSWGSSIWRPR